MAFRSAGLDKIARRFEAAMLEETMTTDERAELDGEEYDAFLSVAGVACLCLTCGERSTEDPHNVANSKFQLRCGACGKHCLPEEELTPETWGILLCKRAGAVSIFKDTTGHVWMYERISA
jgi:hypothetical protein